jgi:hypothetical protein
LDKYRPRRSMGTPVPARPYPPEPLRGRREGTRKARENPSSGFSRATAAVGSTGASSPGRTRAAGRGARRPCPGRRRSSGRRAPGRRAHSPRAGGPWRTPPGRASSPRGPRLAAHGGVRIPSEPAAVCGGDPPVDGGGGPPSMGPEEPSPLRIARAPRKVVGRRAFAASGPPLSRSGPAYLPKKSAKWLCFVICPIGADSRGFSPGHQNYPYRGRYAACSSQ